MALIFDDGGDYDDGDDWDGLLFEMEFFTVNFSRLSIKSLIGNIPNYFEVLSITLDKKCEYFSHTFGGKIIE
jgi:hypothetical protein